jgi:hypothetical protein
MCRWHSWLYATALVAGGVSFDVRLGGAGVDGHRSLQWLQEILEIVLYFSTS